LGSRPRPVQDIGSPAGVLGINERGMLE
jgi:hypothetical protein